MDKPFGDNMQAYWDNGFSPLPTQIDGKAPALSGVTGRNAKPDIWKLKDAELKFAYRNLAITGQIHKNGAIDESQSLIAIDNDDESGEALLELEEVVGVKLPPTLTVTSRGPNNPRTKRLYRVHGVRHNFKGSVCDERIDICSDTLRCIVMEGEHKGTKNAVVIYDKGGKPLGRTPRLNDISWAPNELVEFLTKSNGSVATRSSDSPHADVGATRYAFEADLDRREPTEWTVDFINRVAEDPNIGNQKLFEYLVELVQLCNLRERGTAGAFDKFQAKWFGREHKSGNPAAEWEHALDSAVAQTWDGSGGTFDITLRELVLRWQDELIALKDAKTIEELIFDAGSQRPLFAQVMRVAELTGDNPAALLLAVLAQCAFEIPWNVYFESDLGLDPLNLMIVLIGPSGAGKSIITQHAEDSRFFIYPRLRDYVGPSDAVSGEAFLTGLVAKHFLSKGKYFYDWRNPERNKFYNIDEIGMLEARSSRQGSTIRETMLSLHSGSSISRESASGENWAKPKNSFRVVFQIGAQPRRSDIFFNDDAIAAGFAGRCLWAPVTREHDLEFREQPSIEPLRIELPDWQRWAEPRTYRAPSELAEEIWDNRNLYARGEGDPMESHTIRNKARIATILAATEGRTFISDDDIELAEYLVQLSRRTYKETLTELAKAHAEAQKHKGNSDGIRGHHGGRTKHEMDVQYHAKRIKDAALALCGSEPLTIKHLRTVYKNNFSGTSREFWAEAITRVSADSALPEQLKNINALEAERQNQLETTRIGRVGGHTSIDF
jgi:hypothetical protein